MASLTRFAICWAQCLLFSGCWPAGQYTGPEVQAADAAIRAAVAVEASLDPTTFPPRSVGVLPLEVTGDSLLAPLGFGLAELIMTDLARSGQLVVVDRLRIQALLRELELSTSRLADPARGPRVGRILGARQVIVGSLTAGAEDRFRVAAAVTQTEDARILDVVGGTVELDDLLRAQKALVFRLFDAMHVTLTPAERAAIEQQPTRSLAALMAFSRGVRAETELRLQQARREYREALRLDGSFSLARERGVALDVLLPDPRRAMVLSADVINRGYPHRSSDVVEPAFQARQPAVLIIPIIVH